MAQQGEATADGTAIVAAAAVAQQLQASSDQQEQSRSLQESHEVLRIQKTYFIFQHDSCCLHCHGLLGAHTAGHASFVAAGMAWRSSFERNPAC